MKLDLHPGQMIGIIGPSGSGKTSLARVIAGAARPSEGAIRLDGSEYDDWDSDRLARHIGYLPQSPSLFAGSIRDNIARFQEGGEGDSTIIDGEVVAAARAAGSHELIQALPGGYDAKLGPYGAGLSAGQAQRVALARAFFRSPVLLVLDEPNSNMDQDGEAALLTALKAARERGVTIVLVAHRTGILAHVDQLVVVNQGRVQLSGPRDEVLARLKIHKGSAPVRVSTL